MPAPALPVDHPFSTSRVLILPMRVLVRSEIDGDGPACHMSDDVATAWLIDAVAQTAQAHYGSLLHFHLGSAGADPLARRVVLWAGGWHGAVRHLHDRMAEKVAIFRRHGDPVRPSVEHTIIRTAAELRRLAKAS